MGKVVQYIIQEIPILCLQIINNFRLHQWDIYMILSLCVLSHNIIFEVVFKCFFHPPTQRQFQEKVDEFTQDYLIIKFSKQRVYTNIFHKANITAVLALSAVVTSVLLNPDSSCGYGYLHTSVNICTKCTLAGCLQCESLTQCSLCKGGFEFNYLNETCDSCEALYGLGCSRC
mmetsp:Transcript_21691/g.20799  ORF Transcript_21691/g.20799 Transcript_21691/m.20799 type:complete len:173 (-) Transcript_21691:216-734(-)